MSWWPWLLLALVCITQPFNPISQFVFPMLLWGVALLVRRIPWALLRADAYCSVADRFLSLHLVALHLDAELE